MRPIFISVILCLPSAAASQSVAGSEPARNNREFQLGGAASRAAIVATTPIPDLPQQQRPRLSMPLGLLREETARTESTLGPATVFLSDGTESGQDMLELGTFLSRGQATAGLSVTYIETENEVTRSEVFLDYAVTGQFSVGVSGIFDGETDSDEPLRQLGVNAEYATESGTYIQGGFAGTRDYDPVIGLSVGLRF